MDGLAVKFLEEEEGYGAPPLFLGCGKNDLREEEENGEERERDGSSEGRTKTATPVFGGGGGSEAKWKSFGGLSSSFSSSLFSTTRPTSKKVSMYHGRTRGKDKGAPKRTEKVIAFVRSLSSRGARVGQLIQKMELSWIRIDYTRDRGEEAGGLSFSAQGKQEKLFWFGREYMYIRFTFVTRG